MGPLLQGVSQAAGKDLKPERLGEGLVPPTNKWFSGLVFGDTAQPVFPLPLSFGVDAKPGDVVHGPSVTRYEFTLDQGVKLSKLTNLADDIALALGIKLVFFALALTGHASMWLAVLADMGVSLLVVANGLRLRRWTGQKA